MKFLLPALAVLFVLWLAAIYAYRLPVFESVPELRPDALGYYHYRGAIHVHTSYSHDSTVPVAEVVAAAKSDDLDFLIVTDHNHMGVKSDAGYKEGVMLIAGVEESANQGHFIILGSDGELDEKERRNADFSAVKKLGGFSILAHPFGGRTPWRGLEKGGYDGVEIVNMEEMLEEAATFPFFTLLKAAAAYLPNTGYAVMSVYKRPVRALKFLDSTLPVKTLIVTGGSDAHGSPPHRDVLGAVVNHVLPAGKLNGEFDHDSKLVIEALRNGRSFVAMDGFARADAFSFDCAEKGGKRFARLTLKGFPEARRARAEVNWGGTPVGVCERLDGICEIPAPSRGAARIEVTLSLPGPLGYSSDVSWIHAVVCGERG